MPSPTVDGSAIAFQADPFISDLYNQQKPYYGLVLTSGWPPSPGMKESYEQWINLVRNCFDPKDLSGETPPVYLYPGDHLHVTIATFYPITPRDDKNNNDDFYLDMETKWKQVVQAASQRPEWPSEPIQLQAKTSQIGTKAAIIMWDEITGGIQAMRSCLQQEARDRQLEMANIPGIVHSSFLRFHQIPLSSEGDVVQTKFRMDVLPQLPSIFSKPFVATDVKLACERKPYMHIPCDESHVFLTIPLKKKY